MSTLKVNKIENTATTDGGIAIDNTGHVQIDNLQMPTAGPLSNRNLIINGDMRIAQRGTSSTSTNFQTVDRWSFSRDTTVGVTQSQQTLSSGSPYDEGFRHFMRAAVTTANTANSRFCQFSQPIEAQNVAGSGWDYTNTNSDITVTFWARSSLAGTYYLVLRDRDTSHYTYPSSFALSADTWTKVTKTIPGNSNLVFNNDNGVGLEVLIKPDYGSDFTGSQATNNAWYDRTGNDWVPDYAQTWEGTVGNTFDLTGVQLEVGEMATPFEHRSYGDELDRCKRYYQRAEYDGDGMISLGYSWTSAVAMADMQFEKEMRAAPTITLPTAGSNSGNISFLTGSANTPSGVGSHSAYKVSKWHYSLKGTGYTGLTDDSGSWLYPYSTTAVFEYSAEL